MPLTRLLASALLLALVPGLARAGPILTTERVVAAGRTQKIAWFTVVDPACHSMGPMSLSLLEPPSAGQIQIAEGREYPSFSTLNTRSRCNTRRLPATQLLYTAAPGYVGEDAFTVEAVGPLGGVQRVRYRISVR